MAARSTVSSDDFNRTDTGVGYGSGKFASSQLQNKAGQREAGWQTVTSRGSGMSNAPKSFVSTAGSCRQGTPERIPTRGSQSSQRQGGSHASSWVDPNNLRGFKIGDVITAFDVGLSWGSCNRASKRDSCYGEAVQTGKDTYTLTLSNGQVLGICGKFRPGVVVAVFEDRMTVVPMFTHGGKNWDAVNNLSAERVKTAYLLTTQTRLQDDSSDEEGQLSCPSSKKLGWKKTGHGYKGESVLYADTLFTVHRAADPKPQHLGRVNEESIFKLVAAVAKCQIQGGGKDTRDLRNRSVPVEAKEEVSMKVSVPIPEKAVNPALTKIMHPMAPAVHRRLSTLIHGEVPGASEKAKRQSIHNLSSWRSFTASDVSKAPLGVAQGTSVKRGASPESATRSTASKADYCSSPKSAQGKDHC